MAGGVGYDTAGRAAVGICVGRRDAKAADGGVFGSCGLTAPLRACALGGFSFPCAGGGTLYRVPVLEDSA